MARIRSLKPEAFSSETLAEVSVCAERTMYGMSTLADDRGRLADKPAQINGELWSMRGSHSKDDLEAELCELEKAGLVCRYAGCDGKRYLHLVSWDRHQKIDHPSKTRLPRCPHHLVSVTGKAEECGPHEGNCPVRESFASPREPSRGIRGGSGGLASAKSEPDAGTLASENSDREVPAPDQGGSEDSANPREGSREAREGSRLDLGSRTVDLGSVPTTSDAAKTPRRGKPRASVRTDEFNPGPVVASFVEGATDAGLKRPASSICARVGKQARELYREGYTVEALTDSARRMGAGEWNDLAVQVRKDDAAANGRNRPARGGASDDLSGEVYGQGSTRI